MAEFLRRQKPYLGGAGAGAAPTPCHLSTALPALNEFLTAGEWGPGERRETGTILIVSDGDRFKMWLNDRDGSMSAWLSATSLAGLLEAADAGLREGSLEWRVSGKKGGRKS